MYNDNRKKLPVWAIILILIVLGIIIIYVIKFLTSMLFISSTISESEIHAAKANVNELISKIGNHEQMIKFTVGESLVKNNKIYCNTKDNCYDLLSELDVTEMPNKIKLNYNDRVTDGCIEYDSIVISVENGVASYNSENSCK